jgi:hypothetical protein
MPNPQRLKLADRSTDLPNFRVDGSIAFDKGGINYWDYKQKPKGYYLHLQVVEIKDGCKCYSIGDGSGLCAFLESAERFNFKRLRELCDAVVGTEVYHRVLARILASTGRSLTSTADRICA